MEQFYVSSLNEYSINDCIDQLLKTTDDIILDFSNTKVVRSFEMLIFLINVLDLKNNDKFIEINNSNLNEHGASYAKNMKLFDAIKDPRSIIGFPRKNFSCITRVDYNFLYNFSDVCDWHKGLECYSERLASILI